jgi:hypothetical protein
MRKSKRRWRTTTYWADKQIRDRVVALDSRHLQGIQAAIEGDVRPGILREAVEVAFATSSNPSVLIACSRSTNSCLYFSS